MKYRKLTRFNNDEKRGHAKNVTSDKFSQFHLKTSFYYRFPRFLKGDVN